MTQSRTYKHRRNRYLTLESQGIKCDDVIQTIHIIILTIKLVIAKFIKCT